MFQQDFYFPSLCFVSTVSPKIVEISSDISINEGNNISLTCIATGRPEPTVTWRHISPKGKRGNGRIVGHSQEVVALVTLPRGAYIFDILITIYSWLCRTFWCSLQDRNISCKISEIIFEDLSNPGEMNPSCCSVKWW